MRRLISMGKNAAGRFHSIDKYGYRNNCNSIKDVSMFSVKDSVTKALPVMDSIAEGVKNPDSAEISE